MTARLVVVAASVGIAAAILTACGSKARAPKSTTAPRTTTSPSPPPPTVMNAANCKPPAQHPYPVVLLPGTYGVTSLHLIGPQLAQLGYCVSTLTYGNNETGDIAVSAHELASYIDRLLSRSGASRVSIVGHSEGGMMARYYIKFLGGTAKVESLVGLAPSNHGTLNPATFGGAVTGCTACAEQQTGSSFLTQLNAGDETPPPVNYTTIETMYDAVVIPYTSAFLNGPSTRVTDVTLQQQCPRDFIGHVGITSDPVALQWVENALANNNGPADANFAPSC
jgi:triacylglycerol lipase